MCWTSVPPSATLRTWWPRQIASSGTPSSTAARAHREVEGVVVGVHARDLLVDLRRRRSGGVDVGAARQADPSKRDSVVSRSSNVASSGGSTTGCPPARPMASRYERPTAATGTRHVSARSDFRDVSAIKGRDASETVDHREWRIHSVCRPEHEEVL